jgi:restriction system protein
MNMPIPDYQTLMLPLLKIAGGGKVQTNREARDILAEQFKLTEDERKELLPSERQGVFDNRIGWARTFLKKAGLIDSVQRGQFQITERGKSVLAKNPPRIDVAYLRQFPEFLEFSNRSSHTTALQEQVQELEAVETPEELVESGYLKLRHEVEHELLLRVKKCPPEFFEWLVVKLLTTIGYGGSLADAGRALGKTGDGGVDGVIKEDKLGLDVLYIQAKRWDGTTVGRPEIQKFVGALHGKKARRGIFITTSTFSKDAQEYADSVETKVILMDGARLAELMFEYGVGVTTVNNFVVKRIDSDFFEDDVAPDVVPEATTK